MTDKRKAPVRSKKAKKSLKQVQEPVTPRAPEDDTSTDYGGMNLSNFKRNLGCGG